MNLLKRKVVFKALAAIGTVSVSMALQACSSSDDSATATAATSTEATITGTLSSVSSSARLSKLGRGLSQNAEKNFEAVAGKSLVCVDPEGNLIAEATIGTAGEFSVPASTEFALSCSIVDADGNVDGNLVFENPSQVGLDGRPQITDAQQFKGSANLGDVVLDEDSQNAKADMTNFLAQLATVEVDSAAVVALSGHYQISGYDLPDAAKKAGYKGVCPPEGPNSNHNENDPNRCDGPPDGYALYLNLNSGTTTTGGKVFPMMLWQTKSAFEGCGSVVGSSAEDLLADLGVVLDNGAGEFTYSTSVSVQGNTVNLIDGWKPEGATSDYSMNDCDMGEDNGEHVWKCTTTTGVSQYSRGGGCYLTGTTTPAQPDMGSDWGGMTCTNTTTADGYDHSECTGSMSVESTPTNVTCTNEQKIVKADGTAGTYQDFDWNAVAVKIAQGALCESASDELTKLRCYSNAYYRNGVEQGQGCVPRIRTDWTATTAEDFVDVEGPKFIVRALGTVGQTASGQPVLTGLGYHEEQRGVQVENSSGQRQYVACKVGMKEKISIAKSDTDGVLLATYESTSRLLTTGVPACDNEYSSSEPEKFMFKFTAISDAAAEAIAATQEQH